MACQPTVFNHLFNSIPESITKIQHIHQLMLDELKIRNTQCATMEELTPDPEFLLELAHATMPFGKYAGRLLIDLPEPYVVWFRQKGFPGGKLGKQIETVTSSKPTASSTSSIPCAKPASRFATPR